MVKYHDGTVGILWGRAETQSPFFVPDFISLRTLPDTLWGDAVDTTTYNKGSGEAYSMDWREHPAARFKGTAAFWVIYLLNYLLVIGAVLWALKCLVGWLKSVLCATHTTEEQKLIEEEGGGGRGGVWCRCVGRGVTTFCRLLSLTLCVVGVAAQAYFVLDDGCRWRRQSLNVMGWQLFHLVVVERALLRLYKWRQMMMSETYGSQGLQMELAGVTESWAERNTEEREKSSGPV